ncbi:MAG: archaellin/type IV pilin N-terminal domain-containing protein, partial [Candidatus Thorarchaeota archaeon]
AITPVIATLLLIAITVAAVAGFYIFYNSFIKQSKVSSDNPSITLSGPSTANPGDTIVISIKNSGNVDLTSWEFTQGLDESSDDDLSVGSQISFTSTLGDSPPWTFQVTAYTTGGSQVQDILIIEGT